MTTKPTIKQRMDQLTTEVDWFYGEDFSLDEAVDKYKAVLTHAQSIQKDLDSLKNEIIKIEEDFTKM